MHSNFLKEMGITEWTSRDALRAEAQPIEVTKQSEPQSQTGASEVTQATEALPFVDRSPQAHWLFFGAELKGDAQVLFQNMIRALGLSRKEWTWNNPGEKISIVALAEIGIPIVAVAFGGPAAQKITGERDPLPQLRETILALNTGNDDDIPVVATLDLNQLANKTKEKALLWQDLLLAKSVLQNS